MASRERTPEDLYKDALLEAQAATHRARAAILDAEHVAERHEVGRPVVLREIGELVRRAEGKIEQILPVRRSGCFPGSALVATPNGGRPIALMEVGDPVLSWSLRSRAAVVERVTARHAHPASSLLRVLLDDGQLIRATPMHRFLTSRGWLPARRLRAGDSLMRAEAIGPVEAIGVQAVRAELAREPVYSIFTSRNHAYIVDGVVVHDFAHLAAIRAWWHRAFVDPQWKERARVADHPVSVARSI